MATEAPVGVSIAPTFSSSTLNLDQGYVTFTNEVRERVTIHHLFIMSLIVYQFTWQRELPVKQLFT